MKNKAMQDLLKLRKKLPKYKDRELKTSSLDPDLLSGHDVQVSAADNAFGNQVQTLKITSDGETREFQVPIPAEKLKLVIVINNLYSNAPNTTLIASGAGEASAAGSNAAVNSSNTEQQQSVGSEGQATNIGIRGEQKQPQECKKECCADETIDIIINKHVQEMADPTQTEASGTQVSSGAGKYTASGTNSAVSSANTKQQHAVGGGENGRALNDGIVGDQDEVCCPKHHPHHHHNS